MCVNSKGPGETAQMRRLAWAFAGRLCDKYHNLMSWLSFIELHLCFQRIPFSDHINTSIKDQTFLYLQQCNILTFLCEDNDSWYKNALTPRATDKTLNLYFICTKTPCIFQIYKAKLCWARHAVPKDICIFQVNLVYPVSLLISSSICFLNVGSSKQATTPPHFQIPHLCE